jgi:predicted ester cyclase
MAAEEDKRIIRDLTDGIWNRRDLSVADKYVSPNLVPEGPMSDQFPPGPEGQKAFASTFLNAFPDVEATIDRQEVDGDWVHTWITFRGTHTGQLMDIPATGRRATVSVHEMDRVVKGKIVESQSEWDPQDMFRQLGVG